MPGINGIAHVELSVRDLDKSVRWYRELLGAQDVFRATNDASRVTACAIFEPRSKLVLADRLVAGPRSYAAFTPSAVCGTARFSFRAAW
jgi:catechol 2,3-dioxygenase-like lactoylglutathione lyase family enzyme